MMSSSTQVIPLVCYLVATGFDRQSAYPDQGLLPAESMCQFYHGPSGSYKSFAAVSLACHVATGKGGIATRVERGAVLYIAGEGWPRCVTRIRAWCDQYNNGQDIAQLLPALICRYSWLMAPR